MSGKENSLPSPADGELSAEQRARISQSFKAAKALFDRKRRRIGAHSAFNHASDSKCTFGDVESTHWVQNDPTTRLPLSEIHTNLCTQVSTKCVLLSKNFDGGMNSVDNETTSVNSENPSFKPCSRQPAWADDLDESIFEQIDALCEQVSSKKGEKENRVVKRLENVNIGANDFEEAALIPGFSTISETRIFSDSVMAKEMPDEYAKYINSLSDRQREAACYDISIPLMIVAGPGSGKTSTMVGRVLMLLNEGIDPTNILAMTFTTAATAEMRERIGKIAGNQTAKQLVVSTFHSFSLQLCRMHAEKLGRTTDFLIYGHGQQRKAVVEAIRLMEEGRRNAESEICGPKHAIEFKSPKQFKDQSKKWLKSVVQAKAAGSEPEQFYKIGNETGAIILKNYNDILKSCNALDYHDLISCSVKLLTDFPEVYDMCQEAWKAIIIDEFQDTSAMQYSLLKILASHKRITIIGDEDQSIFSFNGADACGFDSFRKDFHIHKEVRLNKNYRSTGCITEAASVLIEHNLRRCNRRDVMNDNFPGSKITVKECCSEEAQCAFVVDKILEIASDCSSAKSYNKIAVLFRRQLTGRIFQTAFRNRKIPFNIHGVAFYRKKVVRAIISMLNTAFPGCDDSPFRRAFKALMLCDKEEKKKVIQHIDKVSTVRKCSFIAAARDIFNAKISGTFTRSQLTQGRKVLQTLDTIFNLVHKEHSISTVITAVANILPQKYLLDQRAVVDVDEGKMLNEDNDLRSVLEYLLDDVSLFLTTVLNNNAEYSNDDTPEIKGCAVNLKAFLDYLSGREKENFRLRKCDNENSVTLTTIHQSKGLEWDTVFIVKANEAEIPLLHENNGMLKDTGASIEEERRLFYVAMTRARTKLYILYAIMDSSWQILRPSRFLREIPRRLLEVEEDAVSFNSDVTHPKIEEAPVEIPPGDFPDIQVVQHGSTDGTPNGAQEKAIEAEPFSSSTFLKRFDADQRAVVSHIFHQWAKKPAFHDPKRLLNKVGFVIDERLRANRCTHKDVLRELKSCLQRDDAYDFAVSVLRWQQLPADTRALLTRQKQGHFQKLRIETAMGSSEPTHKQVAYLQSLGCTIIPSSRLHASKLIEEYKSL